MLKRIRKDDGMTLVEVIVSMLVLSITAVTVMSAFSMASRANLKAKKQQSVESLMENFLEYAEGGGADFKTWFGVADADYVTPTPVPGVTPGPVKEETLYHIQSGFQEYSVKVTTDTAPAKYQTGDLNGFKVIQFGGSESNAILIDASGTSNDDMVCAIFHGMHTTAVAIHDLEEEAKEAADETYVKDLWSPPLTQTEVCALLDREIWIESEMVSADKFRLVGYIVYKVSDSLRLPDGTDRTYKIPLCYSEEFDSESSAETSPRYLKQIYLMYSQEKTGDSGTIDIRFWDPAGMLNVNLYVVKQATTDVASSADAAENGTLGQYFSGGNVRVSCKDPVTSTSTPPVAAKIYSPLDISGDVTSEPEKIKLKPNELVAKDDEVRVVTVTIQILDPDTGDVLANETVTRLQ